MRPSTLVLGLLVLGLFAMPCMNAEEDMGKEITPQNDETPPPKGPPSLRQYPNKGPALMYKMPPSKKQQQYHKVSASSSSSDLGERCSECGKLMVGSIWTTQLVPANMMSGRACCSIECLNSYCEAKLDGLMNAYSVLWAAKCNLAARPQ